MHAGPRDLHTGRLSFFHRSWGPLEPFDFTKGAPVLRYDALANAQRGPILDGTGFADIGTALFDLANDPRQEAPLRDA